MYANGVRGRKQKKWDAMDDDAGMNWEMHEAIRMNNKNRRMNNKE